MSSTPASSKAKRPSSARARAMKATAAASGEGDVSEREFISSAKWAGPYPGMVWKQGPYGQGYYPTASSRRSHQNESARSDASADGQTASTVSSSSGAGSSSRSGNPQTLPPPQPPRGQATPKQQQHRQQRNFLPNHSRDPREGQQPMIAHGATGTDLPVGMPTDLPYDAAKAIGRRADKQGLKELAIPLGDGWMQRAGRGTFATNVSGEKAAEAGRSKLKRGDQLDLESKYAEKAQANGGAGPCMQIESTEPNFFLLTYDQNPDAHVVRHAHYKIEVNMRCLPGNSIKEVPYAAIVLDWRRTRSTITAPCFTGVVCCGTSWRIEQYADGTQTTLAEVHDSSLKMGSGLSMAAPWQRVSIEVRGDRIAVHANKRPIFGSFVIPPPPDTTLATGKMGSRGAASLTGPCGMAVYKSRCQLKSFDLQPLEGGPNGGGGADGSGYLDGGRTPRPPFAGGDPKLVELIEGEMLESAPKVDWESIGGLSACKRLLNEAVALPLIIPEFFASAACRSSWKGVLLFGPPGTGKTLLARAVASLGKTAFFNISASSLVSHYHGESEKLVRTLFALARHHAPSVIFFDEVDALVSTRGAAGEHEASRRLKSELLMQMDGVGSSVGASAHPADSLVMTLATSNKPWDLDEAMRRRLERRIYVPLPDETARKETLSIHLRGVTLAADVDVGVLSKMTEGYSGADLHLVCRDASLMPMRRAVEGKSPVEIVALQAEGKLDGEVSASDFRRAMRRTPSSVASEEVHAYALWNTKYGSASLDEALLTARALDSHRQAVDLS